MIYCYRHRILFHVLLLINKLFGLRQNILSFRRHLGLTKSLITSLRFLLLQWGFSHEIGGYRFVVDSFVEVFDRLLKRYLIYIINTLFA